MSGPVRVCRDLADLQQAFREIHHYDDAANLRAALPGLLSRIVHCAMRVAR
jgi:hypothetical protein